MGFFDKIKEKKEENRRLEQEKNQFIQKKFEEEEKEISLIVEKFCRNMFQKYRDEVFRELFAGYIGRENSEALKNGGLKGLSKRKNTPMEDCVANDVTFLEWHYQYMEECGNDQIKLLNEMMTLHEYITTKYSPNQNLLPKHSVFDDRELYVVIGDLYYKHRENMRLENINEYMVFFETEFMKLNILEKIKQMNRAEDILKEGMRLAARKKIDISFTWFKYSAVSNGLLMVCGIQEYIKYDYQNPFSKDMDRKDITNGNQNFQEMIKRISKEVELELFEESLE